MNLRENSLVKLKSKTNVDSLPVAVGDVVVLKNDSSARCFWKLGKIEELLPGRDGKVRAAVVKTTSKSMRPQRLRRVIEHLIPVEVNAVTETAPNVSQEKPDTQVCTQ